MSSVATWRRSQGRRALVLVSAMVLFVAGCGLNLFSLDDDVKLGQQTDQQIRANPKEFPILNNESVRGYVQQVVNRVIQSPEIKYRGRFPYQVTIINDDKTVNAFATPGGYIYVYTGLLKFIDNEATLAGILGHEIGHSELRHGTQQMTEQVGAEVILGIALGNNPTALAQMAANATSLLTSLANSRSDESQADAQSVKYLRSTSYYPGAIKSFFTKVESTAPTTGGGTPEWLSTHPSDEHRTEHIDDLLTQYNIPKQAPSTASLAATPYQAMLRNLH